MVLLALFINTCIDEVLLSVFKQNRLEYNGILLITVIRMLITGRVQKTGHLPVRRNKGI